MPVCRIVGCERRTVAKGLCKAHYNKNRHEVIHARRLRDPSPKLKPGPKPSEVIAYWRGVFPDWSKRTLRDFIRAMSLLTNSGGEALYKAVIGTTTKPTQQSCPRTATRSIQSQL